MVVDVVDVAVVTAVESTVAMEATVVADSGVAVEMTGEALAMVEVTAALAKWS